MNKKEPMIYKYENRKDDFACGKCWMIFPNQKKSTPIRCPYCGTWVDWTNLKKQKKKS